MQEKDKALDSINLTEGTMLIYCPNCDGNITINAQEYDYAIFDEQERDLEAYTCLFCKISF